MHSLLPSSRAIERLGSRRGKRPHRGAESSRTPEAAGSSHTRLKLLHDDNFGRVDALDDELGNSITLLDGKIGIAQVEQDDLDLATVVSVDDASARVNAVLGGEAGAGGYAAVFGREMGGLAKDTRRAPTVQGGGGRVRKAMEKGGGGNSQVPSGTAIEIPVETMALPLAGTLALSALYKS